MFDKTLCWENIMEQKGVVIFVLNVEQAIKNFTAMSVDKK